MEIVFLCMFEIVVGDGGWREPKFELNLSISN